MFRISFWSWQIYNNFIFQRQFWSKKLLMANLPLYHIESDFFGKTTTNKFTIGEIFRFYQIISYKKSIFAKTNFIE